MFAIFRIFKARCMRDVAGLAYTQGNGWMRFTFPIFSICFTFTMKTGAAGLVIGGAFPI